MGVKFNPDEQEKYIQYLDANNMYGWVMSQPLPVGNFKWMSEREIKNWGNFQSRREKSSFFK